jgi:hypothetical protein
MDRQFVFIALQAFEPTGGDFIGWVAALQSNAAANHLAVGAETTHGRKRGGSVGLASLFLFSISFWIAWIS